MSVFPVVIDCKPSYAVGARDFLSLLLMPHAQSTLLAHLSDRILTATGRVPLVVRSFAASPGYDEMLARDGAVRSASLAMTDFSARASTYEPSDWLLLIDPRCFPADDFDLDPILSGYPTNLGVARHLVALDGNPGGTNERIECDAEGRVRRVQRYYDAVTWTVTTGVAASLVPVSSLRLAGGVPAFGSLPDLRRELAARMVPCRDIPIRGPVFDLTTERDLLQLNERLLRAMQDADRREPAMSASRPEGCDVHPSARLLGQVVLQPGVSIAEEAMVIGPAVLGVGARIERGAVVAQSVVAAGAVVPSCAVIRHRVIAVASESSERGIEPSLPNQSTMDVADSSLAVLREEVPRRRVYPQVKTVVEAAIAAVALLILSPLLLLMAALIKLESRGPVFYADPREAKGGELFRCFKFRTMKVGADIAQRELMAANQVDGPQFKINGDPRVTRLGKWLREVSLDELPQLINVARGEMSLIGPRPSPFRENQTCVPWRDARLSVRPGITGLWQVCRHERQSGDFHQWIYYDMQYVRHMSPWLDIKIMIATILTLGGKGHVPFSWMIPSSSRR